MFPIYIYLIQLTFIFLSIPFHYILQHGVHVNVQLRVLFKKINIMNYRPAGSNYSLFICRSTIKVIPI